MREKNEGEKRSPPTPFFLVHRFLLLIWLVKISTFIIFLSTFGLKMSLPFWPMSVISFLHIMLVLGYYYSMMLRGEQSLYEVITIAQRLLLADMSLCLSSCLACARLPYHQPTKFWAKKHPEFISKIWLRLWPRLFPRFWFTIDFFQEFAQWHDFYIQKKIPFSKKSLQSLDPIQKSILANQGTSPFLCLKKWNKNR